MWLCYVLGGILFGCWASFLIFEVHYFNRMLLAYLISFFKKKRHILDECTITGEFCLYFLIFLLRGKAWKTTGHKICRRRHCSMYLYMLPWSGRVSNFTRCLNPTEMADFKRNLDVQKSKGLYRMSKMKLNKYVVQERYKLEKIT